ncbi:16S rRNA (uracil(1498)-N(3))-methyltransferase [Caminibacter pacificus]|uniref:Ribosomal RNA small subunit methyltransferase E n=1 Tax=Caminibacter pacificus TaxID=1424653 RepID=A0AAJ4RBW3_9BACT|nr:16S rRNA (uracil(1498)-N(3))-methyltransferase [Caminibacter pacificus]QCI28874.1 16S rRNA (uracil(1498)-N(3))-methyltransferase [Caminibacter pacificus]ROR39465.1 16S rRNA (uracil1498-N3)-methyltransferase [Caminibacter pacificus]
MQFLYYENPKNNIIITGENHKYLFRVRRIKKDETVKIRNLKDDNLYIYKIDSINKKEALLSLINTEYSPNKPKKFMHLAWCVIDPKNIEKTLPALNEMGVSKISFVYCDFSQKNFKLKLERLTKILINSSQQCGRSDMMEIEIIDSSDKFFEKYPDFIAIDFNGEKFPCEIETKNPFLIGPEGGFSQKEKEKFKKILKFQGFILRSETAACALSAKYLL